MKNFLMKSGLSVLSVGIVIAAVVICMAGANRTEYMKLADMAENNAEYVSPVTNSPGQSRGKADESLLKKGNDPFTAEDFSYMVLDGIRIDLPCTLGDLEEHFELKFQTKPGVYEDGAAWVSKDGVRFMKVTYYGTENSNMSYSDCVVYEIIPYLYLGFAPEVVLGGVSSEADLSDAELKKLFGGTEEYVFSRNLFFETAGNGFVMVECYSGFIKLKFYDSMDDVKESDRAVYFTLYDPAEIHMKDSYDPETYEPISLDGLDLSAVGIEMAEEPEQCLYDILLDYQKENTEAYIEIWTPELIDDSHVYLNGRVFDSEGNFLTVVGAVLCDGQELGEALVVTK